MNGKFKVWNNKNKCWMDDSKFFIGSDGDLYTVDLGGRIMSNLNNNIIPIFSTGKADIHEIELFDGDKLKSGHTIVNVDGIWCGTKYGSAGTRIGMPPLDNLEKIGSKYED